MLRVSAYTHLQSQKYAAGFIPLNNTPPSSVHWNDDGRGVDGSMFVNLEVGTESIEHGPTRDG